MIMIFSFCVLIDLYLFYHLYYKYIMHTLAVLTGIVEEGNKRGKRLGFPTLNMELTQSLPEGIYISQTEIAQEKYNSLTFIGAAKTFHEEKVKAETYLFAFDESVYGRTVTVTLLQKIRDNRKFASENDL